MARPESNTVTYFPHIIGDGKKIFYIESKYKNDGYATWFKILEQLALTPYHFLNLKDSVTSMHLSARCFISEDLLCNIINDLTRLGVFDKFLWEKKIIWCDYFITNIRDAYNKRTAKPLTYPNLLRQLIGYGLLKLSEKELEDVINSHSIVYDSISDHSISSAPVGWRESFDIYKEDCLKCFELLKKDKEWFSDQEKFNPGADILLTLEKSVKTFWACEAGWKFKKRSRTKEIDWHATLTNAVSQKMNKVWKGKNPTKEIDYNNQKSTPA